MVNFLTLDKFDDKILEFRYNVSRMESDNEFKYWFSSKKFENMSFVNIEAAIVDSKVIAISGCSLLDDYLRICQLLYVLPNFRTTYRDLLIRDDGFISRHITTAKKLKIKKMLYSMHVANKKTEKAVKVMLNKRHLYNYIKDFTYIGINKLNNTEQHCFVSIIDQLPKTFDQTYTE
jgi:hypothetical protein